MHKVSVSRAVKAMMEKGLLERITDTHDRRRRQLFLTAGKGRKVLEKIIPRAEAFEQEFLQAISPSEQKALVKTLDTLQRRSEEIR